MLSEALGPSFSFKYGASRHHPVYENTRPGCSFYHTKSQAETSYGGPVRAQKPNLGNAQKNMPTLINIQ